MQAAGWHWLERLVRLGWPAGLVAAIWLTIGRLGFSILDEGMIPAYSRRLLDGQIPHEDIISARPLGSALVHVVDLAVPLPLFTTIRLIGIAEVVVYTLLLAYFLFGRGPLRWTLPESLAVAAAALVNLHTFPLMSWYTTDGILLVAAGLALIRLAGTRGDQRIDVAAMLCLGAAVVMKQSFFPAPLLGALLLAMNGSPPGALVRAAIRRLLVAAIPGALYLVTIAALGALPEAVAQMTSGQPVWGRPLLESVGIITSDFERRPAFEGRFPFEIPLLVAGLLLASSAGRRERTPWAAPVLAGLLGAAVLALVLAGELSYAAAWSLNVMWAAIAVVAVRRLLTGSWSRPVPELLALGWMTMLSWGNEVPALVAGSMALALVVVVVREDRIPGLSHRLVKLGAAGIALIAASAVFVDARRDAPYYDRPASDLVYDLGDVDDDLRGIRTSRAVATYVASAKDCIARYPASSVAILPDNAGLYPVFDIDNPFPLDWVIRGDYPGFEDEIADAAVRLGRQGDYLVLFQIVSGFDLYAAASIPAATRRDQPIMFDRIYDAPLARRIIAALDGRRIVCGPFLGIYEPTASSGGSSSTGVPPRRRDSVAASSTPTTRRAATTSVSGAAPVSTHSMK